MPVPRGSFAMGAPQLAENAPPKKRGELYGNRVPGLGRPSGVPVGSRAGSPLPSTDDSPGPRKRCISTGTTLSTAPSSFSTDVPVPALPNDLAAGSTSRRNSLAVNFSSGRRVMSSSDADGKPPIPETTVEETPLEAEKTKPGSPEVPTVTAPQPLEPPPVVEEPLPADPTNDTTAGDSPAPHNHPSLYDVSQNLSQSPSTEQSSRDGQSEYESAPQSAISQPSPSLPQPPSPVPSSVPIDTPSDSPKPAPARTDKVVNLQPRPLGNPTAPVPISIQAPNPPAESRPQSKSTFKAVVHRKVTEQQVTPAASRLAPPATSKPIKQRRGISNINVVQVPPSPGTGDLAVLLGDAALLELRLTEGMAQV
ncbi:hypothetical protein JVT61DRAFT_12473 [Boletus reticuloceps]|uniref:Uncharacterized protein n=1 Tax=Boletus reticuloceps TaxID=495285 RepID=A0A8I3A455_9AGAM|nr:hypothetical protein JVT61DRAFT_12473 [Boletus reticuloceps]